MIGGISHLRFARHAIGAAGQDVVPTAEQVEKALRQVDLAVTHLVSWPRDVQDRADELAGWLRRFGPAKHSDGRLPDGDARHLAGLIRRLADAADRHAAG